MAMYKSLFDLSPEQTASTAMPRTVVFSNETGSGSMTNYPLFSGAELYYNDMHLASFDEAPISFVFHRGSYKTRKYARNTMYRIV